MKARHGNGNGFGLTLGQWVRLWPTPTAGSGHNRGRMNEWGGSGSRRKLNAMVERGDLTPAELNGQLNPRWVEWLMGFPLGWTNLEGSETLSSHKSPNGSESES